MNQQARALRAQMGQKSTADTDRSQEVHIHLVYYLRLCEAFRPDRSTLGLH
jgi:hypothetical protein